MRTFSRPGAARTGSIVVFSLLALAVIVGASPEPGPASEAFVAAIGEQELVELRTGTTRVFLRDDGTMRTERSSAPLDYLADDGSWQPVDATVVQVDDGSFVNEANTLVTRLPATGDGEAVVWRRSDGAAVRLRTEGFAIRHADGSVSELVPPVDVAGTIDADGAVLYDDAKVGVSERWTVTAGRVRHQVQLENPLQGLALEDGDVLVLSWLVESEGLPALPLADVAAMRTPSAVPTLAQESAERLDVFALRLPGASGQLSPAVQSAQEPADGATRVVTEVPLDGLVPDENGAPLVVGPTAVDVVLEQLAPGDGQAVVLAVPPCSQQQKLTAADGAANDQAGFSVAVDGDTAIVGAFGDDIGANTDQGSAYVYVRTGTTWSQQAKLTASDGAAGDAFGWYVALSGDHAPGDTAIVGAIFDDVGGNNDQGSAYVFVRNGGAWSQQVKLTASDGGPDRLFGTSVALSGNPVNTAAVGAYADEVGANVDQGSAYVFRRSLGTWSQEAKLTASDGATSDVLGWSISVDGDTLVVGAWADDVGANVNQGSAYVFLRSGTTWSQQAKLTASDGAANDTFGIGVSVSGNTAIVGTYQDDVGANVDQGSAYVFTRSGSVWSQQQKLLASDGAAGDLFGISVSVLSDTAVVGSYLDDVGANVNQGSAYVFTRSGVTWTQQQKLVSSDGAAGDEFGRFVEQSLSVVAVGADLDDIGANANQGSAYVLACANVAPSCDAGVDLIFAECDGVQLSGFARDDGDVLTYTWSSSCPGTTFSPNANVLAPVVTFGSSCNVSCDLTLTVDDGNGGTCQDVVHVTVNDTRPPTLSGVPANATVECSSIPAPPAVTASDNCGALPVTFRESVRGPANMVHWYRAEDDALDTIGTANGTLVNGATFAAGEVRRAFSLDGVNDYVTMGSAASFSGTGDITVDAWIRTSSPAGQSIVGQRGPGFVGEYVLNVGANHNGGSTFPGRVYWMIFGGAFQFEIVSAGRVDDGKWHHVAAVREGVNGRLYIDGVLDGTGVGVVQSLSTALGTHVGSDRLDNNKFFQGNIDEVELFTRALSQVEIQSLVTAGPSGKIVPGSCLDNYTVRRTWTATDACGNSTTGAQDLTVRDTTPPTLVGVPANTTIQCDQVVPPPATVTATDNCAGSSMAQAGATLLPYVSAGYRYVVTTRSDSCTPDGFQVPTFDDAGYSVGTAGFSSTSPVNCGLPVNTTWPTFTRLQLRKVINVPAGTTNVTVHVAIDNDVRVWWNGTDISGCRMTENCAVPDKVVLPVPQTLVAQGPNVVAVLANDRGGSSYFDMAITGDVPAGVTVTFNETEAPGSCPQAKTITRTWTATDRCSNSASATQTINVVDTTGPVITCPANQTIACDQSSAPANTGTATATDNCDGAPVVTFSDATAPGSCPQAKTITRTWTATDACLNSKTCVQTITVRDTTGPVIACPTNRTIECDQSSAPANTGTATATDNCDGAPVITFSDATAPGSCPQAKTITRTWTATDACLNSKTCVQTITVRDTTAPVIACPTNRTIECDQSSAPANTGTATATDNCDGAPVITFSDAVAPGSCPQAKTITRTWTATDACANFSTCNQTITVRDTTAPVITCPTNRTIECDQSSAPGNTGTATATDNCDGAPVITFSDAVAPGSCPQAQTITRTWKATDACLNSTTCVQTITVRDTTGPVITCPTNRTIECDQSSAPGNTGTATATDNCDGAPVITFSDAVAPGSCPQAQTITRTWKATDACLNSTTCVQTITVRDTTGPVITCPTNRTIECDQSSAPGNTGTATATDNCDGAPVITFSDAVAPGSCPQAKTITRTWKATDACANFSTCNQTITVRDTTAPVITCPANKTVECSDSSAPSNTGTATATDNCGGAPVITFSDAQAPGSCPQAKIITRTWKATDACGNSSTCNQTVNVVDTTKPVITCPANKTIECDESSAPSNTGTATATDNCDSAPVITFTDAVAPGSCPQAKTITRTWKATDACSNFSTCNQTITVRDTKAPAITCPANRTIECDQPSDPSNTGTATATDNCDSAPVITFTDAVAPGRCPQEKTITRTWKATDACSNSSTCNQTITVVDTTSPVITCPANVTIECDQPNDPSATGVATATDNCDAAPAITFSDAVAPGRCPQEKTITRTWKATDACGNSSTCNQTIAVIDTTAPVPMALLQPAAPLPPQPPHSVCAPPTSRAFNVTGAATDNCDANPAVSAKLLVTQHDVPVKNGPCVIRVDEVSVALGELVEIHLVAPPCPAKPPKDPRQSVSVNSAGVKVITGEKVVLRVTATDACGNAAFADDDPTSHLSPLCDDKLIDGTCCPAIAPPPPDKDCKVPCAP